LNDTAQGDGLSVLHHHLPFDNSLLDAGDCIPPDVAAVGALTSGEFADSPPEEFTRGVMVRRTPVSTFSMVFANKLLPFT
jgi:hypothetical protein